MIKYNGISTLEVLEKAINYNNWISSNFKEHITYPLLEVGAGTGNISELFLHSTFQSYLTDSDMGLVHHLEDKFKKRKNVKVKRLDVTEPIVPELKNRFSSILAINVFEHIDEDQKALKNTKSLLKKDGKLFLLVPAKMIAYTKLDKELGHFRRYEKEELKNKLFQQGYNIEKLYYFNFVGLFSWVIRSLIEKEHKRINPSHVKLFDSIVPPLHVIESLIKPPVGISLIAIAGIKTRSC